jgi:aspartate-semialdehyde dehydrogenase
MQVALVGATGLVGREILAVLDELDFPVSELIPVASQRSIGTSVSFRNRHFVVRSIDEALDCQPNLALFSADSELSRQWARAFAMVGSLVIDNSSAWRMDPDVPLVVPEVNLDSIGSKRMIANPNCTTIQLAVVLHPLAQAFGLERVIVSTYQSVTGTGQAAINRLEAERRGESGGKSPYPHPIDLNCIPQCDVFAEEGYTKEEWKVMRESRKILGLPDLAITCTAVRVPVLGGHSESVNLTLSQDIDRNQLIACLKQAPGLVIMDEPAASNYPMPILSRGRNEVFVGRIRKDRSAPRSWNLWIVADNLRKGAATNAVQIAQSVFGLN